MTVNVHPSKFSDEARPEGAADVHISSLDVVSSPTVSVVGVTLTSPSFRVLPAPPCLAASLAFHKAATVAFAFAFATAAFPFVSLATAIVATAAAALAPGVAMP